MTSESEIARHAILRASHQRDLDLIAKARSSSTAPTTQKTRQEAYYPGNAPFWDERAVIERVDKMEAEARKAEREERNAKRRAARAKKKVQI